jgi:hypothetical protein
MALMATIACYDADDLAGKVIPAMTFTLVDKEKYVPVYPQTRDRLSDIPRGQDWCETRL